MDALTLLTTDHRKVDSLFESFQVAATSDMKKGLVDSMSKELSIHAGIEELHFYPTIKDRVAGGEAMVKESLEEHQQIKEVLAKLERMEPSDASYDTEVRTLMADVQHHVQEEENELFPKVRAAFTAGELMSMGEELEKAKSSAPTHPHPAAPAEGAMGKVAGMAAGMADRARDAAGGRASEEGRVREDVVEETPSERRMP